jgi:hypothetical protein
MTELHRIEWTMQPDSLWARFVCTGDADAECHIYCREGCEQACDHDKKSSVSCGLVPWFDDDPAQTYYNGPDTTPHDGPIVPEWTGDGYTWSYAASGEPA